MTTPNLYLSSKPYVPLGGRKFRKELITAGTWHKGDQTWDVTEQMLLHWAKTHKKQVKNGLKVTMPVNHTDDPEANRGYVLEMEVDKNENGVPALFGICEFAEGHEKLAKTCDVSIFAPASYVDGKKNTYTRPIRHVALTNDPVVSGLGKFEPIAASFGDVEVKFSLRTLAKKLRVNLPEGADDAAVEEALVGAYKKTSKKLKAAKTPPKEEDETPVAASMVGLMRDNRGMKLDQLVREGRITKVVRDDLAKQFISDAALTASLKGGDDAFDSVIASLAKNEPVVRPGEKTPMQMSQVLDKDKNPLLRDAAKRAKK